MEGEALAAEYVWLLWDFSSPNVVLSAEETITLANFWATKQRPNRIDALFADPGRVIFCHHFPFGLWAVRLPVLKNCLYR
jgi:hypothetical protein